MGPRHLLRGEEGGGGGFFCGASKGGDFSEGLVAINDGCTMPPPHDTTEVDTLSLLPPASTDKTVFPPPREEGFLSPEIGDI